jgi:putative tricarboxylic transport membrane protein
VATLIMAAFAPPLTEVAFKFGPAEYFSLMVLGLIGAVVLASGSLLKAIAMILLGLLLGPDQHRRHLRRAALQLRHPGTHRRHRLRRHRDGRVRLRRDHRQPGRPGEQREVFTKDVKGLWPTKQDFKDACPPCCAARRWARCWASCPAAARCWPRSRPTRWRRRARAGPGEVPFGKGNIRGVAGPESANNAGAQTSFIPMLTLGIPPNAVMALMVGAMTIKGIQPGPAGDDQQPRAVLGPDRQHVGRQR